MAGNKKVINATSVSEDGIEFKSKSEKRMYDLLKASGLKFSYEPERFTIIEGFYPRPWYKDIELQKKKQIAITYKPDFIVWGSSRLYVIEVKGFEVEKYLMRRKLFLDYTQKNDLAIDFFEVHTVRGMKFCIEKIKELENGHTNTENK